MTDTFNAVVFGLVATVAIGAMVATTWAQRVHRTREGNER